MRSITIRYEYSGSEESWRSVVGDFIAALDADAEIAGKFTYQVSVADKARVHWGRWDSQETLKTMQSRPYFKTFSEGLKGLLGGQPEALVADVALKTAGW